MSKREAREYPEYERKTPRLSIHELRCETDSLGRKYYFKPDGTPVCGRRKRAKNRKIEDEACCAPPTAQGPCRVHGAGGGRPWSAGGRHSRVLRKLRPAFERAMQDASLLDSRPELAMMDVVVERLVRRVEAQDSPAWRQELKEIFEQLEAAIRRKRQHEVGALMKQLGDHIRGGAEVDQLADDLTRMLERRANQAAKINALTIRRDEHVSLKELGLLFGAWIEVLRQHLEEKTFYALVPQLRTATDKLQLGPIGSAESTPALPEGDDEAA